MRAFPAFRGSRLWFHFVSLVSLLALSWRALSLSRISFLIIVRTLIRIRFHSHSHSFSHSHSHSHSHSSSLCCSSCCCHLLLIYSTVLYSRFLFISHSHSTSVTFLVTLRSHFSIPASQGGLTVSGGSPCRKTIFLLAEFD